MARARKRRDSSLESQAVGAHRAYVEALASWGRALHTASCPACRPEGTTEEDHLLRCASAEAEKERRRVVFRDLCDELGYVPDGHDVALPPDGCPSASGAD
mgnify:FL=1